MMCFRIDSYENVRGGYLDTPADLSLQFTKTNILFAFDSVECERTTAFTLNATPQNNMLLGFINDTHNPNAYAAMRTLNATLEGDSVTRSGYIYVQRCSEDSYECVFVCGDLLGLKKIKGLGNISDMLTLPNSALYGAGHEIDAYMTEGSLWIAAKYGNYIDGSHTYPFPSLSIKKLVDKLAETYNVSSAGVSGKYRLIPPKVAPNTDIGMVTHGYNIPSEGGGLVGTFTVSDFSDNFTTISFVYARLGGVMNTKTGEVVADLYGDYQMLSPKEDIVIAFPEDTPTGVCLVAVMSFDGAIATLRFLGDYSFDPPRGSHRGGFSGTPLRGREVTIPRATPFLLYDFSSGYTEEESGETYTAYYNFPEGIVDITAGVSFSATQEGRVPLQPYLPKMTVIDLFKNVAALQGGFLRYVNNMLTISSAAEVAAELSFLDVSDRLIEMRSGIERTFANFAQTNVVEMNSADYVPQNERAKYMYEVDNELLAEKKILQTIAWSEGRASYGDYGVAAGVFDDTRTTVGLISGKTLIPVTIGRNKVIDDLCVAQCKCTAKISMPLYMWDSIKDTNGLYFDGQRWMWTETQWNDGVAQFTLQLYNPT